MRNNTTGFSPKEKRFVLGKWRKNESEQLDVHLKAMAPRLNLRTFSVFVKMAGPLLSPLLSGFGGLQVRDKVIPWAALVSDQGAQAALAGELAERLRDLDPEQLLELAEAMLVGHCTIGPVSITNAVLLDAFLPDGVALGELVGEAFRLNYLPTTPADTTAVGTSAGAT